MFSTTSLATIYKWEDADGKVHYSETKPPAQQAKKMKVQTRPPENTSTYKRPGEKSAEDEAADQADGKKAGNKADNKEQADKGMTDEEKAQQCERARKAAAKLTTSGRFKQMDKDGNVSYMTDEEKQNRISREQERMDRFCQ